MWNRIKRFTFLPEPDPTKIKILIVNDNDIDLIREALTHYCEFCRIGLKNKAGAASHRRAHHKV